jgi:hypothetical protein
MHDKGQADNQEAVEETITSIIADTEQRDSVMTSYCFMNEAYGRIAYLFDKPNGNPIDSIQTSVEHDFYACIELIEFSDDYAHINAGYFFNLPDSGIHRGWIKLQHLGIYISSTCGQEDSSIVKFYKEPTLKSEVADSICNPIWGEVFPVVNCSNGWIQTIMNNKKCWISPDNQEPNNVTPSCM